MIGNTQPFLCARLFSKHLPLNELIWSSNSSIIFHTWTFLGLFSVRSNQTVIGQPPSPLCVAEERTWQAYENYQPRCLLGLMLLALSSICGFFAEIPFNHLRALEELVHIIPGLSIRPMGRGLCDVIDSDWITPLGFLLADGRWWDLAAIITHNK